MMIKTKLPVIVLRNMILLPHGEIRLEISNDEDKKIIEKSSLDHDNYALLISPEFIIDEDLEIKDLPTYGVIGKITSNFELPNGNTRISILGVNRAHVYSYLDSKEDNDILDGIIGPIKIEKNNEIEEEAKLRALKKKFSSYILSMPNISNSLAAKVKEENSLEKLTDIIVNLLPLTFDIKLDFVKETNSIIRADLLLDILSKEKEVNELERNIENELKIELDKSQKEYILREKIKVIKNELGEHEDKDNEINVLKDKIKNLNCDKKIKEKLFNELHKYESLPVVSPENSIVKNYIDIMLSLPWNEYTEDNNNLKEIEKELNQTHFGLKKVKNRILEYISVKQLTNDLKSPIICLVGPPGVGKTTLAFSIAKALNRNFVKISVGGVSDEAEIIGHRRTYLGSAPGRIITGLKKARTSNPLFLIDEIDKMTKDIKGDPASTLLEVLDPEQNKLFVDNYIEEEYDLSKVMFVLTANDVNQIPYALRDRLEIINLSSYTEFEKIDIVNKYMYDKLLKEHGLTKSNVNIDNDTVKYIIEYYTKEAGVRELERVLSQIMRKVSKRIVSEKKNVRCKITKENIKDYLGVERFSHIEKNKTIDYGIVNGLGYTPYGGEIIPIEVSYYKGKGNVLLTGSLGDVMKESANIALGYIKSNSDKFGIDLNLLESNDIHINAVEASIPKDGPSAGTTLTTGIISALLNKTISEKIAMTGEITLKGNILEIGGLREKVIAAYNNKIEKIFIPKENEKDLEEIQSEIKENINFVLVDNYKQIFDELFK